MGAEATKRLSAEQVDKYRTDGFILVKEPVFPEAKFRVLIDLFDEKLLRLPPDVRPENMDVPHFTDTRLFEWLFADEVLDLVEPLLGPDLALFTSHFVCKPGGSGKRVPWHTDAAYWRDVLSPMEVCTVWLAIDPSTTSNGCMRVIPGSHLLAEADYEQVDPEVNVFAREIADGQRDESKAVPLELDRNQASLHDGRMQHSSEPNTAPARRCGYTMRYISTRVKFNREGNDYFKHHQIYLARGRDHAGNEYGDPARTYEEAAKYRELHVTGGH
jgi:hypothetical protein